MRITGRLADSCPNGHDCPRIHDTDGDHVIVQGDKVTDPGVLADLHLPETETAVSVPRDLIYPAPMTLTEMAAWLDARHTRSLLRIENRDAYASASDGGDFARFLRGEDGPLEGGAWRERLARDTVAGRRWAKVHIVRGELSAYESYCAHWAWPGTTAAGEFLQIHEAGPTDLVDVPDFFVVDGEHVVRSVYDERGKFTGAHVVVGPDAAVYRALASALLGASTAFGQWWDAHPDQHHRPNAA